MHDWVTCPFSHPGEKAKRRDPRYFVYTGIACPSMKKARVLLLRSCLVQQSGGILWQSFSSILAGRWTAATHLALRCIISGPLTPDRTVSQAGACPRGEKCPYAHNVFEYWLHPTR